MENAVLAEVDRVLEMLKSGYQLFSWIGGASFLQATINPKIVDVSHGAITIIRKKKILKVVNKMQGHGDTCFVYELKTLEERRKKPRVRENSSS